MKRILTACMCLLILATTLTACAPAKKDQFVVGFDQEFPPMGFVDESGAYVGFDLDLAKEVAKRLDMEFVPQPIAWESKDQELASGNIDCVWNGFTMNKREDKYTWTTPYMNNDQIVLVNSASGITTLADLSGKIVCVQKDSSGLAALNDNPELLKSFEKLVQVDSYLNAKMELEAGAVDAVVMDKIVAYYQIGAANSDFMILDESVSEEQYGVGFFLGNTELRDKVQKALEEMAADGTLAKISNDWFQEDITTIGK